MKNKKLLIGIATLLFISSLPGIKPSAKEVKADVVYAPYVKGADWDGPWGLFAATEERDGLNVSYDGWYKTAINPDYVSVNLSFKSIMESISNGSGGWTQQSIFQFTFLTEANTAPDWERSKVGLYLMMMNIGGNLYLDVNIRGKSTPDTIQNAHNATLAMSIYDLSAITLKKTADNKISLFINDTQIGNSVLSTIAMSEIADATGFTHFALQTYAEGGTGSDTEKRRLKLSYFATFEGQIPGAYPLLGTYEFNETGNALWPNTTGMGAYFGTGYGVSSDAAGGTLKAPRLLKDVPVDSNIRVVIESVTNDASATTNVKVYGLNYSGERIAGISGSYTNPNHGGAKNLLEMQARAAALPGVITLPLSSDVKVYGLEVVFESATKRSLLCKIDVRTGLGTDAEQAASFVKLVNNDVGNNANGKCAEVYATLQNDYNILSAGAKSIYEAATDADSVAAKQRMAYLQAWVAAHTPPSPSRYNENSTANIRSAIIIGALGLTAMFGFYFLNKKKKLA